MANIEKKRKPRDNSRNRQLIIDSAIRAFSENGYDATSMEQVAQAAGISKRTIYNHFASKDDLFQELLSYFYKRRDEMRDIEYLPDAPLKEQLKEFVDAELDFINDSTERGLSKILASVLLRGIELGTESRSSYQPPETLIAWLNAAKADGKMKFDSAELCARFFYGMIEGCLAMTALVTDGESLKTAGMMMDDIINIFLIRYGV
jgi:TetR/AcrR family transcriptional regulator of autoinduction and epiphytic fitness